MPLVPIWTISTLGKLDKTSGALSAMSWTVGAGKQLVVFDLTTAFLIIESPKIKVVGWLEDLEDSGALWGPLECRVRLWWRGGAGPDMCSPVVFLLLLLFLPATYCSLWLIGLILFITQSSDGGLLVIILVMASPAVCIMCLSFRCDMCELLSVLYTCSWELLLLAESLACCLDSLREI